MICPNCSRKTTIVWTEKASLDRDEIRRRRECRPCMMRWTTSEVVIEGPWHHNPTTSDALGGESRKAKRGRGVK